MAFGSNGTILRVDLTSGTTSVETFDEAFYRRYPGGKALAAYHLLRDMPAGADPLGPDNVLVLATGLLTAAPVSTATRFNAIARSPLTGGFGESEAGGYWGPELKMAGFDAIILTGRSPKPVWIWVKDGAAEIRDARALWGQDPPIVQAAIKEAVDEKNARVLQIGRAGENLVPYAMLMNELRHYNGRTGMGAVMGSKNVRAIAVKGSRKYADLAHDPAALGELGRRLSKSIPDHPQGWDLRTKGTPGLTDGLNAAGILPTRNFRQGSFEQVEQIGWHAFEAIRSGTRSCYACAVRCKPETAFEGERYSVTDTYDGPEYEAIAGFGSNCAIFDLELVARANELCNEVGIDVISAAGTVAFVMECVEHGLLDVERDLGGLDLRFGNGEAVLEAIPLIADRNGRGRAAGPGLAADRGAAGRRRAGLRDAGQGPGARDARAARQGGRGPGLRDQRGRRGPPGGVPRPDLRQPRVGAVPGRHGAGWHRARRRVHAGRDQGAQLVHERALEQRREGAGAVLLRPRAALVHPGGRRRGGRARGHGLGRHGRRAAGDRRAGRQHGAPVQQPRGVHPRRRPAAGPPPHRRSRGGR